MELSKRDLELIEVALYHLPDHIEALHKRFNCYDDEGSKNLRAKNKEETEELWQRVFAELKQR